MSDVGVIASLSRALHRIRTTPPRIIASPATQPRRAAVAIIIRVTPNPAYRVSPAQLPTSLPEFFLLDWVNDPAAQAEILFLRRGCTDNERTVAQNKPRNADDAHVAFPGGRTEEGDEGGLYTAMRQTWEEIGIDLAEKDFMLVGQLDDREITTSLGKRLLMILSPFVFLQVSPQTPSPDPNPGTQLHWIPLSSLLASTSSSKISAAHDKAQQSKRPSRQWSTVSVDISSRLAPRHSTVFKLVMRTLLGSMEFNAILLDPSSSFGDGVVGPISDEKRAHSGDSEKAVATSAGGWVRSGGSGEKLKLWGLSLGMTLDLIAYMHPPSQPFGMDYPRDEVTGLGTSIAPSMTSVFPRFSYPDVNFWIWVFGKRYRDVLRGWEASARAGGANDRRINWVGTAVNQFYAAVRKALVVVLVLRSIGLLIGFSVGTWWVFFR
ncbi:hypothetical protein SCHPADRAFT_897738 [Schizopora paradoxa]|uniref:Nudix hydrolase domain-containing protein n=1 Tax=Schizopora paradoxa TaxID=27342 RepID=A0A0H2SFB3_9AGAM|nr:hypothetical protein SCHPADRAFT_897738 [Schizopora paradoxa]